MMMVNCYALQMGTVVEKIPCMVLDMDMGMGRKWIRSREDAEEQMVRNGGVRKKPILTLSIVSAT